MEILTVLTKGKQGQEDMRVAIIRKVSAEVDSFNSFYSKPGSFPPTTMEELRKYGGELAFARTKEYLLNDPQRIIEENQ